MSSLCQLTNSLRKTPDSECLKIIQLENVWGFFFPLPRWLWCPGELFQTPDIHVAKIIFRNYINEGAVVQLYLHPSSKEHSHQTKSGALNWNCVRMCPVPPLWWCADQTAQTFSIEELARWRAETTRHHALQAPTDRLPTASRCALHPSCALSCLFWVRLFYYYYYHYWISSVNALIDFVIFMSVILNI